jgi:hypothetical protein
VKPELDIDQKAVGRALAQPAQRMNLICIVTDDQAQWALGAYGNRECVTPNMDRLAREGALRPV